MLKFSRDDSVHQKKKHRFSDTNIYFCGTAFDIGYCEHLVAFSQHPEDANSPDLKLLSLHIGLYRSNKRHAVVSSVHPGLFKTHRIDDVERARHAPPINDC